MRSTVALLLALAAVSTPALAEQPSPLAGVRLENVPLQVAGFPYAPDTPAPVPPTHAIYRKLAVDPVENMPPSISWFFMRVVDAKEFDAALQASFDNLNMLAPPNASPEFRVKVRWLSLDAPLNVGFGSDATATLHYTVVRTEDGAEVFSRDIVTHAHSTGGAGAERRRGNARIAIATNVASAASCIERVSRGEEPPDCALTPKFSYFAPLDLPTTIWVFHRHH